MSIRPRRSLFLTFAATLSVMPMIGCEDSTVEAERAVQNTAAQMRSMNALGGKEWTQKAADAAADLRAAAANASPAIAAHAHAAAGNADVSLGLVLMNEADGRQAELELRIGRGLVLAEQAGLAGSLAEGYRQQDPREQIAYVRQLAAAAQGDGTAGQWQLPSEGVEQPLPTLSASRQEVSQLTSQIATLQEQINTLRGERQRALSQAEELRQKSEATDDGQARVATYTQSADLRKQGADAQVRLLGMETQLQALQQQLGVAQAREEALRGSVEAFNGRATTIETNWQGQKAGIDALGTLAGQTLNGDTVSVAAAMAEAQGLVNEIVTLRQEAERRFSSAAESYSSAKSSATQAAVELESARNNPAPRISQPAAGVIAATDPSSFQLSHAMAQHLIGQVNLSNAMLFNRLNNLAEQARTSATAADANVPDVLAEGDFANKRDVAAEAAGTAFSSAEDGLQNVLGARAPQPVQAAARATRLYLQTAWSTLSSLTGDTQQAELHLNEAVNNARELQQGQGLKPPLPSQVRAKLGTATRRAPAQAQPDVEADADGEAQPAVEDEAEVAPATE